VGNYDTHKLSGLYTCVLNEQYYNDELCPKIWHNGIFDQEVREDLLTIANDFYKHLKLDVPIIDIQLTGSLANYNYTDYSDLDVHIIIDFKEISKDVELVKQALDGARFIWNVRHNIVIRGHDVEVYIQDIHEQHTASGLYSLKNNDWIHKPTYNPPEVDEKDVELKYRYYIKEINSLSKLLNVTTDKDELKAISNRADKLKEKISKSRNDCLRAEGEFCIENLVFKKLRNTDNIEKLIDIAAQAYDKAFSDR
jgi:predicted nucleotidyltransferase